MSTLESGSATSASPMPPPFTRAAVPPLPSQLPGKRRDITAFAASASRALIADLDGDGHAELALADPIALRIVDADGSEVARLPALGGIETLTTWTIDAKVTLVAGWGMSREHRDAVARVSRIAMARSGRGPAALVATDLLVPTTTRAEIVATWPVDDALRIAYFDSKYGVTAITAALHGDTVATRDPVSIRMATAWATGDLDGHGTRATVVGRVYGDAKGVDGDAFVLAPDGSRRALPTTRGVQGLAVADTDGDGKAEIYVGDGWHQNYADHAQGLLTEIRADGAGFRATPIEDTPGQFTIWQIIAADVDGDGKPELVTRGSHYVRVFRRARDGWHGLTIAGVARYVTVGPLDGHGNEIAILGDRSELVDLTGVSW